jgi:hypothetical protein
VSSVKVQGGNSATWMIPTFPRHKLHVAGHNLFGNDFPAFCFKHLLFAPRGASFFSLTRPPSPPPPTSLFTIPHHHHHHHHPLSPLIGGNGFRSVAIAAPHPPYPNSHVIQHFSRGKFRAPVAVVLESLNNYLSLAALRHRTRVLLSTTATVRADQYKWSSQLYSITPALV